MNKSVKIHALSCEYREIGKQIINSKVQWKWSFCLDSEIYSLSVTYSKITGKLKIYINEKLSFSDIKTENFRYGIYLLNVLVIFDFNIEFCRLKIENQDFDYYLKVSINDNKENTQYFNSKLCLLQVIQPKPESFNIFHGSENLISPIHTVTKINNPFCYSSNMDIIMDNTLTSNNDINVLNDTTQLSDNCGETCSPYNLN